MNTILQRELHAYMGGANVDNLANIMNNKNLEFFTKAELLCVALPTQFKDLARAHYQNMILGWGEKTSSVQGQIASELARIRSLGLDRSPFEALKTLPPYSLAIEFCFSLTKPYLSRDDDSFYIIDNPVRKDKVFKVPYVAPSAWKGALRATSTRLLLENMEQLIKQIKEEEGELNLEHCKAYLWPIRAQNILLFGNENVSERDFINKRIVEQFLESPKILESGASKMLDQIKTSFDEYLKKNGYRTDKIEGREGRISLFPTFFNQIGLEIINPHERARGVGTNPILFECVPSGAEGKFFLLYVPFDYCGETAGLSPVATPDEATLKRQVAEDILQIGKTIFLLLTIYGFGAKTSSGFGATADVLIEPGRLAVNVELPLFAKGPMPLPENIKEAFSEEDQITDFISPEDKLRSEGDYEVVLQSRDQNYNRKKRQLYKKVMNWWEEEGGKNQYQKHRSAQQGDHAGYAFTRLSDLPELAHQIAAALGEMK